MRAHYLHLMQDASSHLGCCIKCTASFSSTVGILTALNTVPCASACVIVSPAVEMLPAVVIITSCNLLGLTIP